MWLNLLLLMLGFGVLLSILFITPIVSVCIVWKWASSLAFLTSSEKRFNLLRQKWITGWSLLAIILLLYAVLVVKIFEEERYGSGFTAIMMISLHPGWLCLSLLGLWILGTNNKTSNKIYLFLALSSTVYVLMIGWFLFLPERVISQADGIFFYSALLNLLTGLAFISFPLDPVKRSKCHSIKRILGYIVLGYIAAMVILAIMPPFTD